MSRMRLIAWRGGSLKNGGSPSIISITMIPSDHISTYMLCNKTIIIEWLGDHKYYFTPLPPPAHLFNSFTSYSSSSPSPSFLLLRSLSLPNPLLSIIYFVTHFAPAPLLYSFTPTLSLSQPLYSTHSHPLLPFVSEFQSFVSFPLSPFIRLLPLLAPLFYSFTHSPFWSQKNIRSIMDMKSLKYQSYV